MCLVSAFLKRITNCQLVHRQRCLSSVVHCTVWCAPLAVLQKTWAFAVVQFNCCPAAKCGAHRSINDSQRVNGQLVGNDHIHALLSDGAGCVDEAVHCGWPAGVEGCIAGKQLPSACVGCGAQELLQGTGCTTAVAPAGRSCKLNRQQRRNKAACHLLHCGWWAVIDEVVLVDRGI